MGYWDENGIYQRGEKPEKAQKERAAAGEKRGAKTQAKGEEKSGLKQGLDHTVFGLSTLKKQLQKISPGDEMKTQKPK